MTIDAARVLEAWSEAVGSPVVTKLTPGRVWAVATRRGHRFVLKKVYEARHLLTGYHAVSSLTPWENDDLPALALVTALGLFDYFVRAHELVEESWLRTARWIDDNFEALRLPAPALSTVEQ